MDDSWIVGAAVIISDAAADVDGTAACRATASVPRLEGPGPALDCCALTTSSVKVMICSAAQSALVSRELSAGSLVRHG